MDSILFIIIISIFLFMLILGIRDIQFLNLKSRNYVQKVNLKLKRRVLKIRYGFLTFPMMFIEYKIYENGIFFSSALFKNFFLWKDFQKIYFHKNKLILDIENRKIIISGIDSEIIGNFVPAIVDISA